MASTAASADASAPRGRAASAVHRVQEKALRRRLHDDPNDARSFKRLVTLLARRAQQHGGGPGTAGERADDVAWALAAELARQPRAWYPLIELARLSLAQGTEAAVRRLADAAERDSTGRALATAIALLRTAGHPDEGFRLALAQWRPAQHDPLVGRQLVLAGLEAGRSGEVARHLDALAARPAAGSAR